MSEKKNGWVGYPRVHGTSEVDMHVCFVGEGGLRLVVLGPPWASLKKLRNLKREHGDDSSVEALKDWPFLPIYCYCFEASVPSNWTSQDDSIVYL